MKMKMIKNYIAFCSIILFFVGLVTFKQNIILLQKKEFSNITKLIHKGFASTLFSKNAGGLYCFFHYLGILSYIINNIALKAESQILPLAILLNNNAEDKVVNNSNIFLAFSSFANNQNNNRLASVTEGHLLNKGRVGSAKNEQEEYITINKNESEIEVLKLFREKEMFPSLTVGKPTVGWLKQAQGKSKAMTSLGQLEGVGNLSASSNKEKVEQEWAELKPLLFNYLITKNNQNGIGLDLKNKKLLFGANSLRQLVLPSIWLLGYAYPFSGQVTKASLANCLWPGTLGGVASGNSNYNFNFNSSNQSNFNFKKETPALQKVENKNWYLSEDLIKLISAFFKSIYCLISKPKFINTPDKIIIEILYYITIPDYKIFNWYNFIYNSSSLASVAKGNNSMVRLTPRQLLDGKAVVEGRKMKRRNKSIKLILRKNNLIKKTLFKLNNTNITKLYFNKFIILFKLLSSYFKKPIEFNLIRLHKSNYDSNILAQLFYLILKKKNIRSAIHNLYTKNKFSTSPNTSLGQLALPKPGKANKVSENGLDAWPSFYKASNSIPAYISGLYIHIGGRLMREPIIPRKTTKKFEKGAIATGKVNFVDTARITKKNKKGAYTIKIAFAQNFMFK